MSSPPETETPYYTWRGLPGSFVYGRGIPLRVPWLLSASTCLKVSGKLFL